VTLGLVVEQEFPQPLCNAILRTMRTSSLLVLVQALLKDALEEGESSQTTLLRLDSGATAIIAHHLRRHCDPFLRQVCRPLLRFVCKRKHPLELDPSRLQDATKIEKNAVKLRLLVKELIQRVHTSLHLFDEVTRDILRLVHDQCNEEVEGTGLPMVASFVFLRFICPAIASPKVYGLSEEDVTNDQRRTLILVLKTLQNITNNVGFDSRESYLIDMNPLIAQYHQEISEDMKQLVLREAIPTPSSNRFFVRKVLAGSFSSSSSSDIAPVTDPEERRKLHLAICRFIHDYAFQSYHLLAEQDTQKELLQLLPQLMEESPAVSEVLSSESDLDSDDQLSQLLELHNADPFYVE
jgi:hypothetical protein